MSEKTFSQELELLIRARYPLIYICTWEEQRVKRILQRLAQALNKKLYTWDGISDMRCGEETVAGTRRVEEALDFTMKCEDRALFHFPDMHLHISGRTVIRRLRIIAQHLSRSYKNLIISSSEQNLSQELEKDLTILDLPLPDHEELRRTLDSVLASLQNNSSIQVDVDDRLRDNICTSALGLTHVEAELLFLKAAVSDRSFDASDLSMIIREKKQSLRKTQGLDYIETEESLESIGGLKNLKSWLSQRKQAFSPEARRYGLPMPRGLMLLGVQGCGKSLSAKVIARHWQLPLLRLDFGALFSSYIGSSEANMRSAIRVAETLAPAVLWIDEIEKGLSGMKSSGAVDGGVTARMFGNFLLWLQEKTAPVFVVATANDVSQLPPELFRKGRFDELFFIDLPKESEREDIFSIHIRRRKRDPQEFDIETLARQAEGFSGAEIEAAVVDGMYRSFADDRNLQTADISTALLETRPLSVTMREQIDELRAWAAERTRPAS